MDIHEIINRNYQATVKRGLITPDTGKSDFTYKINEELAELNLEVYFGTSEKEAVELADVILVCLAYAKHFNIDILKELENKVKYNEIR